MSQEALERCLGRLLTDDTFRKRAFQSIETICREAGYDLNPSELGALNRDDLICLDLMSQKLDKRIKRYSGK